MSICLTIFSCHPLLGAIQHLPKSNVFFRRWQPSYEAVTFYDFEINQHWWQYVLALEPQVNLGNIFPAVVMVIINGVY